jgi:hypothetical protein
MNRKYLWTIAAMAVVVGAIVSMTTSGVLAAPTNSAGNVSTSTASTDSDFVKEGLIDDDEKGTGEDAGTDDSAGEQEDSEDCVDDALEDEATAILPESEDADEAGDNDVNDEEDEDTDEDAGETDDKENQTATTSNTTSGAVDQEEEDEGEEEDHDMAFDPCNFSSEIDNPYLPLSKHVGKTLTFEGTLTENGSSVKVKELWNVRSETVDIADVETLVVVVQEYEDGELVEEALQYYAQGRDGAVYYFGEDIADYENGVAVENDDESWTVGDDTAVPGIAMPATPATGMGFAYYSVNVPGIAHELSEVASLNNSVTVKSDSFSNVLEVTNHDFDDGKTSQEFYAPDVGLIKEIDDDEELELVSIS